jgi:hypothetical protein
MMLLVAFAVVVVRAYALRAPPSSRSLALAMSRSGSSSVKLAEGLTKETLATGSGRAVEAGDILAIDYAAYAERKVFAKSNREKFIVRDGSLIKGWDVAVSSMIIGERAKFQIPPELAYGAAGVFPVIAPNSAVELDIKVLAWLGNQLRPETIFSKDLDVDPFIASTPEAIQAEYDEMEVRKEDKFKGSLVDIYIRRLRNISFGFGGSGFFTSQSGEKAPWYLNPNITFPIMISIVVAAFFTVISTGSVKEKGSRASVDPELAVVRMEPAEPIFT